MDTGTAPEHLPDALAAAVELRHGAWVDRFLSGDDGGLGFDRAISRLADFVAAGGDRDLGAIEWALTREADSRAYRWEHMLAQAEKNGDLERTLEARDWQAQVRKERDAGERIGRAWAQALEAASFRVDKLLYAAESGEPAPRKATGAEPRRDMHPQLAEVLGIPSTPRPSGSSPT